MVAIDSRSAILRLDVVVAFGSELILYAFARDADTSFAWRIKAPLTAAFLGAGYWAAMVGLVLAALTRG